MIHAWQEVTERKKVEGIKYKVGDWVYLDSSKKSYGYIKKYIVYRNRDHTEISSISYTIRVIKQGSQYKADKEITVSKDEALIKPMDSFLGKLELKALIDISLDTNDYDYFMALSGLLKQKATKPL